MAFAEPEEPQGDMVWVRVHRECTDSWVTVKLAKPMTMCDAECFIDRTYPGWELESGGIFNPDEVE